MTDQTYFLSSLESYRFAPVRECVFMKRLVFQTGKECALVRVDPPVNGQPWGLPCEIEYFVLANRHVGESLFPVSGFPCFVHIARPLGKDFENVAELKTSDVETVAWGELYRTRQAAENHVLD